MYNSGENILDTIFSPMNVYIKTHGSIPMEVAFINSLHDMPAAPAALFTSTNGIIVIN